MNTSWHELKEKIYFEDGSWRDIYAFDINSEDWKKWCDFVNENYDVEFFSAETNQKSDSIDFSIVEKFWSRESKFLNSATVKIGEINIKCHFFGQDEFENDISPKEINSLENHLKLVKYLKEVSRIFNKRVFLTEENVSRIVLLEIFGSEVLINV